MKSDVIKGSLLVGLGACCYGTLGTYVKMAYHEGFSTAEVTIAQFCIGAATLFLLNLFRRAVPAPVRVISSFKTNLRLMAGGISLGLTSIFYYMAVHYIAVSVAIVLLIQSVWMGVALETMVQKRLPGKVKLLSVILVMGGTILATGMSTQAVHINKTGLAYGLLAALCYTATLYSSNHIALSYPPLKRSMYMILGGLIVILLVFHSAIHSQFSYRIFLHWGPLIALFGTILPPLLFTRGMPLTGMGLGAIIASIEIPVSVITANLLLDETVNPLQWSGVALILIAAAVMNVPRGEIFNRAKH
ncbi:EamA family transporter [Fulvivirgaceae bacterium PWU5]|uniref:EamA family transporter n=1 Tax=Dawidia cretensis TaxID=2782350 RepID=A0AAP2E568_9BACT|nr:DMT family transporter [Dawidia cretensis]MBT1712172.1 EamA family transporter [Dawidia cretensis]